jgi:hypothetical protein
VLDVNVSLRVLHDAMGVAPHLANRKLRPVVLHLVGVMAGADDRKTAPCLIRGVEMERQGTGGGGESERFEKAPAVGGVR